MLTSKSNEFASYRFLTCFDVMCDYVFEENRKSVLGNGVSLVYLFIVTPELREYETTINISKLRTLRVKTFV